MIGTTISHYKIVEKLGEGGMGVVYKAQDTNLKRPVALKFLAAHLLGDEEIKTRFRREAEAAAALNHPNICTVHEISEVEGKTFISMAFLEGEALDKKIESGPLKLKDALDIAIQTAQGLQAAHEKGIVHRDIKPANLMVTGSGSKQHVTIMDFGLAQLADRSKLTRMDETMGTVTYMSPEQTYGANIDHRSDVWSLGVVLYEMVTGQQPFKGHYDKAVMYSITNEEPEPMTGLRTGVPMELELLVNKCLAKDADRRYQSTADMVVDLETLADKFKSGKSTILPAQEVSQAAPSQPTQTTDNISDHPLLKYRVIEDIKEPDDAVKYLAEDTELHRSVAIRVLPQSSSEKIERTQQRKQTLLVAVAVTGMLAALIFAFVAFSSSTRGGERPLRRFTLPTEGTPLGAAISPDGEHIAYVTNSADGRVLWVQDLEQDEARVVFGPRPLRVRSLSWSPDSKFVSFWSEGGLMKLAVEGGPATMLTDGNGNSPPAWAPDGESLIFGTRRKIWTVPARGGNAELFLEAEQEGYGVAHAASFGVEEHTEKLLFVEGAQPSNTQVTVADLVSGKREALARGLRPLYTPSGHVIYEALDDAGRFMGLWALPFSVETMKATGNPFPISQNGTNPTAALDGTLVYLEGAVDSGRTVLTWRDRMGNRVGEIGEPHETGVTYPSLSPDGSRVVVQDQLYDIWIHEVDRPIKTLLLGPERDIYPTWSPEGDRIVVSMTPAAVGPRNVYMVRADGTGDRVPVLVSEEFSDFVTDWSEDGNTLLVMRQDLDRANMDILYLRRKADGSWEETAFLQTEDWEQLAKLSPDGRFVAYGSDQSGEREIYIRSFPDGTGVRRVSANGGTQVRWRSDGRELFYVEDDGLMAVPVSTSPTLSIGTPKKLFAHNSLVFRRNANTYNWFNYDVTPDGQRFILCETEEGKSDARIRVVQNWYEEFRDREQD